MTRDTQIQTRPQAFHMSTDGHKQNLKCSCRCGQPDTDASF